MWPYKFCWVTEFPKDTHIFHTTHSSKRRLCIYRTMTRTEINHMSKIRNETQLSKTIKFNSLYKHEQKNFLHLFEYKTSSIASRSNLFYLSFLLTSSSSAGDSSTVVDDNSFYKVHSPFLHRG